MDKKPAAINIIWFLLVLCAIVVAAYTGRMKTVTDASFESAKSAVIFAIGLVGPSPVICKLTYKVFG